jgi:uncharacterized RDD family membrane protein YckC
MLQPALFGYKHRGRMIDLIPEATDSLPIPYYASFTVRVRALVIDAAVVLAGLALLMLVDIPLADVPGSGRVELTAMFALTFLYEPLLVWRWGATIGHRRSNLRVVADSTGGKPSFGQAFARYFLKTILGLPSFLGMLFTRRHQAIHDKLTRTTVQLRDVAQARPFDIAPERRGDLVHGMPTVRRRLIAIVLYIIMATVAAMLLFSAIAAWTCTATSCSVAGTVLLPLLVLSWLVTVVLILIFGWIGRLRGARRQGPSGSDVAAI